MSRFPMDRRYQDPRAPANPTIRSTVATTALFLALLFVASWPVAGGIVVVAALTSWWAVRRFGWPSSGRGGPATTSERTDRTAGDVAGQASAEPRSA